MINIKEINAKNSKTCYELDLKSLKHWNQNQWKKELEKSYVTAIGIYLNNTILGICVFHKIYRVHFYMLCKNFSESIHLKCIVVNHNFL